MATSLEEPPGGRSFSGGGRTYAALLSSNLPLALKKNVLEIILEKDSRGSFNITVDDCVRVLVKLGIDPRPGVIESIQICPNGRGVVFVTLRKDIPIERFCTHDVIEVTQSGIRVVQVKPAGKRDIVVTLKGVHPNTRDDGVIDYLAKFGHITSTKVVRPVFSDGPLKGIGNGDRMYKLELSPNSYLGTYHVIDGQRVTAKYPGQQQTCARCFGTPLTCPGNGVAKKCEQEGGERMDFSDYIFQLWQTIGYEPSQVELNADTDTEHSNQEFQQFTPVKTTFQDSSKFTGIRVSSFPRDTDHGQIVEFLISSGLPESMKNNISIKQNGAVLIETLPNDICVHLIESIHNKTGFGRRLYCNGIVPRTPDKVDLQTSHAMSTDIDVSVSVPLQNELPVDATKSTSIIRCMPVIVPDPLSPMTPNTFSQQSSETPDMDYLQLSNVDLVRRNSLSLRSPPPGSLAADILNTGSENEHYSKARSIISNIKEISERFSDFASCESFSEDTDNTEKIVEDGFQTQSRKKKNKRKQKFSPSPSKDIFKRLNNRSSPDSQKVVNTD